MSRHLEMQNTVHFKICRSGLGDKLTGILGALVYCRLTKKQLVVEWVHEACQWGYYDDALFDFPFSILRSVDHHAPERIESREDSTYLSPVCLLKNSQVDFATLLEMFTECARINFRPSQAMTFPTELSNAIGIHLRRSDKIVSLPNSFSVTRREYDAMMDRMMEYIQNSMANGATYYICSEDAEYAGLFKKSLLNMANSKDLKINLVEPVCNLSHQGADAVFDLFCLSRCKRILQGTQYSTFSIMAAMIGNVDMYNFCKHDAKSAIYAWAPCLNLKLVVNQQEDAATSLRVI